jgi:hypothetical protein
MSIVTRAAMLARAVAAHVAAGSPGVATEQFQARLEICRECEHYDWGRVRCGACGCFLDIKAAWPEQSCPLDPPRWGPLTPAHSPRSPARE